MPAKFYPNLKELTPILLRLFLEVENEKMLSNYFNKTNITPIPKLDKNIIKKKMKGQSF